MDRLAYSVATEADIPFIRDTYNENIDSLHGAVRSEADWKAQLSRQDCVHYVVHKKTPVGWFRMDIEDGQVFLGMLQISPAYQRRGIGKWVVSAAEALAKAQGFGSITIHTTEDNLSARALYLSCGYALTEIGPCTTADGMDRVGYTFQKVLK